jgi:hypothetical protein
MSHVAKRIVAWSGGLALLWIGGCASQQHARPTPDQVNSAYQSVQKAWASGAGKDANAAPFLTVAERELSSGYYSMKAGDNRNATWHLARAAVDGQLSQAVLNRSRMAQEVARTEGRLSATRASMVPQAPAGQRGEY